MGMGYEIIWESRGACKRFFGHVTDDELMQCLISIESDSRFDDLRYVVNDFLKVESFAVSEESVRVMSAIDKAASSTNPNIRIAIVATDAQIQAMAKLYAHSPLNVYPTEIFQDIGEARGWLAQVAPPTDFRMRYSFQA